MPTANYLRDIGFSALAHPRSNVAPLDLLLMEGDTWTRVTSLDQLVLAGDGASLPPVTSGQSPDVGGKVTRTMEVGFALKLVNQVLKFLGSDAGIDVKASGTSEADVSFESVTLEEIDWVALDTYLGKGRVNDSARNMMIALNDDKLAVVTAVLRSPKISIAAGRSGEGSISIDAPDVGGAVDAGIDISRSSDKSSKVTFAAKDGGAGITFGFRALRLNYEGNVFHTWESLEAAKQLRGPEGSPETAGEKLDQVPTQEDVLDIVDGDEPPAA